MVDLIQNNILQIIFKNKMADKNLVELVTDDFDRLYVMVELESGTVGNITTSKDKDDNKEKEEPKEFISFIDLQAEVKQARIKSITQYQTEYKQHKGWPSAPNLMYPKEWISWTELFGKEKKRKLMFGELKKEVQKAGIGSQSEYYEERKNHPDWPSNLRNVYKDEWVDWFDFLGKEKVKMLNYEQLKQEVQKTNIGTVSEYKKEYRKHAGWPANPHDFYAEWTDWYDFLEKNPLPFMELQKQVLENRIKSQAHYFQEYQKHAGWPSKPFRTHKEKWPGWEVFLGKKKV